MSEWAGKDERGNESHLWKDSAGATYLEVDATNAPIPARIRMDKRMMEGLILALQDEVKNYG